MEHTDPTAEAIRSESARRFALWDALCNQGGPGGIAPALVAELRIHRGQQGVFRDQAGTAHLTRDGSGVALSLRHTGSRYADDLLDDGVFYHYPATDRGARDGSEIAVMKACADLSLPIFVVLTPTPRAPTRNVRLGWVVDHDDTARQLLVCFGAVPPPSPVAGPSDASDPFELVTPRAGRTGTARVRPGQARFRFSVLKRYGAVCAFCSISEPRLLVAAHVCPVEEHGTDAPRNGLIMCLNHHRAFDEGLLLVHPESLAVHPGATAPDLAAMGIKVPSFPHLPALPHQDALRWAWSRKAAAPEKGEEDRQQ